MPVKPGARKARTAGHLIHGQLVPARASGYLLGRIEDLGAATLLLFLAAFGNVIHDA
jgi:hypothetical protein